MENGSVNPKSSRYFGEAVEDTGATNEDDERFPRHRPVFLCRAPIHRFPRVSPRGGGTGRGGPGIGANVSYGAMYRWG